MNITNRDKMWAEYYNAVRVGNKQLADKLLQILHSPPSNPYQPSSSSASSCRSCKSRFY